MSTNDTLSVLLKKTKAFSTFVTIIETWLIQDLLKIPHKWLLKLYFKKVFPVFATIIETWFNKDLLNLRDNSLQKLDLQYLFQTVCLGNC